MVDGLHRGVGIVDRRRKGLASDVDLLPDAESDVLLDGALEANPDIGKHRCLEGASARARIVRRGGPYPAKDRSRNHVLPDPITKADGDVGLGGEGEQQLRVSTRHRKLPFGGRFSCFSFSW